MPRLSDYVSVSEMLALFEDEFEGALVPVASNSLEGAGVYDAERAVSRLATPLDFQSIRSPSGWNEFSRVIGEVWDGIKLQDVLLAKHDTEIATIALNPIVFAEEAGMAYSNYIKHQFEGYIDLITTAIPALIEANRCQFELLTSSPEVIISSILADNGKTTLENARARMLEHVISDPKCKMFLAIIDAMISVHEAWMWFKQKTLSEIWDEVGNLAWLMAEILRDAKIQERILQIQSDPVKLGKVYGTIVGIVVWEVIETVAMAGAGKGLRIIKVIE